MSGIGVVTGSRLEARCLPEKIGQVACSGADAARAEAAAQRLIKDGACGLLSFGLAGALDPGLAAGTLLLPEVVIVPTGDRLPADDDWLTRLRITAKQAGVAFRTGAVAGSDRLLNTSASKRELFESSDALAVDMESHAVALAAGRAGLPFVVVRALADPADQPLPEAARRALGDDGRVRPHAFAAALFRRPTDLAALLRLARQSRAGLRTLRRVAALAGPGLGFG